MTIEHVTDQSNTHTTKPGDAEAYAKALERVIESGFMSDTPITLDVDTFQQLVCAFHQSRIQYHQRQIKQLPYMNWEQLYSMLVYIFANPENTDNTQAQLNGFMVWLDEALME